jgi:hypothetical protein
MELRTGDVIAFRGNAWFSDIICAGTRGNVSHVGVVLEGGPSPTIIDATGREDQNCVAIRLLEDVIAGYGGLVWACQLSDATRGVFNEQAAKGFWYAQEGLRYDYRQAMACGLDLSDRIHLFATKEDPTRWFCSELVTAGLKAGGLLPGVLAVATNPVELVKMPLYSSIFQFKGNPAKPY